MAEDSPQLGSGSLIESRLATVFRAYSTPPRHLKVSVRAVGETLRLRRSRSALFAPLFAHIIGSAKPKLNTATIKKITKTAGTCTEQCSTRRIHERLATIRP